MESTDKLRHFFASGHTRDIKFRRESLKRLRQAIITHDAAIVAALQKDLHKSAYESQMTEIGMVLQELKIQLRHMNRWSRPQHKRTPFFLFGSRSRVFREPYGTVLIMAPWNYPFQLQLVPLIGAVAAGNCVLLKPSPLAPATTKVTEQIIREAFVPEHVTLLPGGPEIARQLLQESFDYIFFTGSPQTGREVMQAAAERLIPVTLELGGKSPCIVDAEANIELAARRIVWGKFLNAGQTCVAPDYVLVHVSQETALKEKMAQYITRFFGNTPEKSPDYPRMITPEAVIRMERLMQSGHIFCGGTVNRSERYVSPTLLDDLSPDSPLMQEEIFGPLLPILTFSSRAEAIQFVTARPSPLALYYFGKESGAREIIRQTQSGGVCINDTILHLANLHLPFGGQGNSGLGHYHGQYSFETFSRPRAALSSSTRIDIPLRYPPYKYLKLLKKII